MGSEMCIRDSRDPVAESPFLYLRSNHLVVAFSPGAADVRHAGTWQGRIRCSIVASQSRYWQVCRLRDCVVFRRFRNVFANRVGYRHSIGGHLTNDFARGIAAGFEKVARVDRDIWRHLKY